jgi:hypothetical protein
MATGNTVFGRNPRVGSSSAVLFRQWSRWGRVEEFVMTRVLEDSISREMISVDPHMAAWTAAAVDVSPRPASRASAVE